MSDRTRSLAPQPAAPQPARRPRRAGAARALAAALAAWALAWAPASAADPVEVTVRLKDGRALKGLLVAEGESGVTLRLAYGEVTLPRADIAGIDRPEAPAAGASDAAPAAPEAGPRFERHHVITLKDGTVRRGRAEDKGDRWIVNLGLGVVEVRKEDVRSVTEEDVLVDDRPAAAGTEAAALRERVVDDALGLEVARPGPSWRFADAPQAPAGRIEAYCDDAPITLEVLLAEAWPADLRDPSSAGEARARSLLTDALRARFRSQRNVAAAPERARGLPVWRCSYEADLRGQKARIEVHELRFHHRGAQVIVRVTATTEKGADGLSPGVVAARVEQAFAAFGFLGDLDQEGGRFADLRLGLALRAPPGWRLRARVLDDRCPLELAAPDGGGRYRVTVRPAEGIATAEAVADRLEADRRRASPAYQRDARAARGVGELAAVELLHRDVDAEGRLIRVRRVFFVERDRVVELSAEERADDPGAEARRAGQEALFASLGRAARPALDPLVREGAELEVALARAESAFDDRRYEDVIAAASEVVARRPAAALAYLLRGRSLAERGRFQDALADLDKAQQLGRFADLRPVLARVQNQQARAVQKSDWRTAERLFEAAARNDPANPSYRNDLATAILARSRGLAEDGKHEQACGVLEDASRRFPDDDRYLKALVRAHHDWARALLREKDLRSLYRARAVLKAAKKLDPDSGSTESLMETVEEQIKKQGGR